MTSYLCIHDSEYQTDFPLSDIEKVLLSFNFAKITKDDALAATTALHKEKNALFNHEKCTAILAFAQSDGSYGHYGLPQKVNSIELIIWQQNNFYDSEILALKIAERLNWQVFIDA